MLIFLLLNVRAVSESKHIKTVEETIKEYEMYTHPNETLEPKNIIISKLKTEITN